ncbi:TIR domain-containing protein [Methanospirillum stamsii]|uniref:Thoeris protein ThsB TIR-like domain-containing protein n=1 Tax=Methanospirillum stamsii TaxID=1277351 RepID=A0A2V2MYG4_9EURY|nr:TIR domain-containing protein [Methanospirillum stamsii]PWR70446.1 hypothetical protein DLD82_15710 [Methanospirillum stamsii]
MPKKVFFCIANQDMNDIRINIVRSHKITHENHGGFFPPYLWEAAAKSGDDSIRKLIDMQIQDSSVSAVLIGTNTYTQRWVKYEIFRSMKKGNKLLGIHINGIEGRDGRGKSLGPNPFSYLGFLYSPDGTEFIPHEYVNEEWVPFKDIPAYKVKEVPEQHRNKIITLTKIAKTYDWVADKGPANFSRWIE